MITDLCQDINTKFLHFRSVVCLLPGKKYTKIRQNIYRVTLFSRWHLVLNVKPLEIRLHKSNDWVQRNKSILDQTLIQDKHQVLGFLHYVPKISPIIFHNVSLSHSIKIQWLHTYFMSSIKVELKSTQNKVEIWYSC